MKRFIDWLINPRQCNIARVTKHDAGVIDITPCRINLCFVNNVNILRHDQQGILIGHATL